jgi:hypothetical protein
MIAPSVGTKSKVALRHSQPTRKRTPSLSNCELTRDQKAALAELAALMHNVRHDLSVQASGQKDLITESYVQELGMRLLEVADDHLHLRTRDWSAAIQCLNS